MSRAFARACDPRDPHAPLPASFRSPPIAIQRALCRRRAPPPRPRRSPPSSRRNRRGEEEPALGGSSEEADLGSAARGGRARYGAAKDNPPRAFDKQLEAGVPLSKTCLYTAMFTHLNLTAEAAGRILPGLNARQFTAKHGRKATHEDSAAYPAAYPLLRLPGGRAVKAQ